MAEAAAHSPAAGHAGDHGQGKPLFKLMIGSLGVVYGDIGTSPLYALRETFIGHHKLPIDAPHILGVISLIFWSLMIVVTFKYVIFTMRADNKGEGGSMALLALISSKVSGGGWSYATIILGVFATALFYGDSMITPTISVLSAVEGLKIVSPNFDAWILPLALVILVGLFLIQSRGTGRVGTLFGPVMVVYFLVLAVLGLVNIARYPGIFEALNPLLAIEFFVHDKWAAFLALGSVVLAVTGAEALYADMGHFGRNPIRVSWLSFVYPSLVLNYFGQGALLIRQPDAIASPFYLLAPEWALLPLVLLATLATIIASQAVITGAFSITQQAIQLGFLPRLSIRFTSAEAQGQIYIPFINWTLLVFVVGLVLSFRSSSNLASAYGIAVTGAMLIDTILLSVVVFMLWNWPKWKGILLLVPFFIVDSAYFSANCTKILDGGWFPLLVGFAVFTLLTTWSRGRALMMAKMRHGAMPMDVFLKSAPKSTTRVPGTAVFLTATADGVPHALLHNMKHNKVLHERVVFLTVKIEDVPNVSDDDRAELIDLGQGFFRLVVHYGFMQNPDIPRALAACARFGPTFKMMETSFFLNRQTLIASPEPGMALWREELFGWMMRNSNSAMEFFHLPTNRVVELGSQLEI